MAFGLFKGKHKDESEKQPKKSTDTKVDKKGVAETKKQASKKPPTKTGTPARRRSRNNAEKEFISARENIPAYVAVMSHDNGRLPFASEDIKRDFVLLLSNDEKKEAILLESVEGQEENRSHAIEAMNIRQRARHHHYKVVMMKATRAIIEIIYDEANKALSDAESEKRSGELQQHFDELIKAATIQGVSDVHIEIRRNSAKIRFRKNGLLEDYKEMAVTYAMEFAGVIYRVIAEEKDVTFKPSIPQDAVIDRQLTDTMRMRIRLATMPAYPSGVDVIMRLLPIGVTTSIRELGSLGYTKSQVADIRLAMSKPVGVTIIAGTTGSGKSTTIATILSKIIKDKAGTIKVISVEDPPEFQILGATQVPVVRSKKTGDRDANPFGAAIRAALRSDPDLLLIGETRDHDSAELLTHAVQSGHGVYTTIHAPSAIGIISRLRSLGAKSDVLGSQDFIAGLVYQTLVQTLCQECSHHINDFEAIAHTKDKSFIEEYEELMIRIKAIVPNYKDSLIRFKGDGCSKCVKGVTGRTVVAEVIVPDHKMLTYFGQEKEMEAWHHWRKSGGQSALDTGIIRMNEGLCDPFDVEHKLGPLTNELVMDDKVYNQETERELYGFNKDIE